MIWRIEENNNILWYTSDLCQLKLITEEDRIHIYLNYKGFNIIMPMIMWDFDEEVTERGIEYSIEGDKMVNWHFIVQNKDLRLFIDLIYFFIKENSADKMLDPDLAIEQW